MYFKNRQDAGLKLAERLERYVDDTVVVMALTDGGILVGEVIARYLRGTLTLLLTKDIPLPGDTSIVGTIDQSGGFTYNSMFSAGQIEEFVSEYHNYLEAEKINAAHDINQMLAQNGLIDRSGLRDKVVILVSDGVKNGTSFDAAMNYLKPVRLKRLVAVAPVAAVPAVDRMHIIADELHVLSVTDNFLNTDHYYDENELPAHGDLVKKLNPLSQTVADKPHRTYT
jgi:predicted phosphoribosyltransferase